MYGISSQSNCLCEGGREKDSSTVNSSLWQKKDENKKIGINMADEVAEDSLKSAVRPERNKSIARYSHKLISKIELVLTENQKSS